MVVILGTDRRTTVLREMNSLTDDAAFFNAIESNRSNLQQLGDETTYRYPTLLDVTKARTEVTDFDSLRMGIWDKDTFVGNANLSSGEQDAAYIHYWLDERYSKINYGLLAVKALGTYAKSRYPITYARVDSQVMARQNILEQAGFRLHSRQIGQSVFLLAGIVQPQSRPTSAEPLVSEEGLSDNQRFVDLPSRREALRAKDKNNLTVFVSFHISKKLYRCLCCRGDINIGDSHAVMSRVQLSKQYTHHHVDFGCVQEKIIPSLTNIEVIDPKQASATAVNARGRKYRNKKRGR